MKKTLELGDRETVVSALISNAFDEYYSVDYSALPFSALCLIIYVTRIAWRVVVALARLNIQFHFGKLTAVSQLRETVRENRELFIARYELPFVDVVSASLEDSLSSLSSS